MSRLDVALRRLVASLPWYDPPAVEARHERSADVHRRSIVARRAAEVVVDQHRPHLRRSRAYAELHRLETARRPR